MRALSNVLICAILPVHTVLAFLDPAPLFRSVGGKSVGGQGICSRNGLLNARQQLRSRPGLGLTQPRMQYDTAETKVKKVLPLNSGGNLIIAERGWILESLDGVDESWGDQAIPIELDDQLAWLLYRDGEVIITITGALTSGCRSWSCVVANDPGSFFVWQTTTSTLQIQWRAGLPS